jgi:BMFP domain-containing protein YqiC
MTDDSIEKLARTLAESLPQGLRSVRDDLEKNFRAVLRSGLGKLDLVTREEFDVQEAVLSRTREKLQALEARLQSLEHGSSPSPRAKRGGAVKKRAGKKPGEGKEKSEG